MASPSADGPAPSSLPGIMTPRLCRILSRRDENGDTFTLEVENPGGADVPFRPGQFNMLWVPGVGESAISISGPPRDPRRFVHTVREVGSVTRAMKSLRKGDCVGVRGPYGRPWPVERAAGRDVVILAGGIGLAPLRPVVYEIAGRRKDFGKVVILYGCRSPEDILYRRELEAWRAHAAIDVLVTVDRARAAWPGNVGVVTSLVPRAGFDPRNVVAMVCGPEMMMRYAAFELMRRGVVSEQIAVSMERNMKCGAGLCGRCQLGPWFVCRDGPVFDLPEVKRFLELREV